MDPLASYKQEKYIDNRVVVPLYAFCLSDIVSWEKNEFITHSYWIQFKPIISHAELFPYYKSRIEQCILLT